jgi:hypothetical protein
MANEKIKMAIQQICDNNARDVAIKISQAIDEITPVKTVEVEDIVQQIQTALNQIIAKSGSSGF